MKEVILYQKLSEKKVRCLACQRKCTINNGRVGFCLARKNIEGKLYSLLYGQTTGIQIDPIEKKPFYHFKPGSLVATIGSIGCNFRCKQCLNFLTTWGPSATKVLLDLSCSLPTSHPHNPTHNSPLTPTLTSPKEISQTIIDSGYTGIAFSYNEPVIWAEFAAEIAREFKSRFPPPPLPTPDTSTSLSAGSQLTTHPHSLIDAANIDFKGFSEKTYQKMGAFFGQIPEMSVYAHKKKIFLEITTLLIPKVNDNRDEIKKMTNFIVHQLGPDIPWHLSEYDPKLAPDNEFQKLPCTPPELLQKAAEIGKSEGLNHIYIWAPHYGFFVSNTTCPKCKKIVIKRSGWTPTKINITQKGNCQFCNYKLNIVI